jgi:hypothetical protein
LLTACTSAEPLPASPKTLLTSRRVKIAMGEFQTSAMMRAAKASQDKVA